MTAAFRRKTPQGARNRPSQDHFGCLHDARGDTNAAADSVPGQGRFREGASRRASRFASAQDGIPKAPVSGSQGTADDRKDFKPTVPAEGRNVGSGHGAAPAPGVTWGATVCRSLAAHSLTHQARSFSRPLQKTSCPVSSTCRKSSVFLIFFLCSD